MMKHCKQRGVALVITLIMLSVINGHGRGVPVIEPPRTGIGRPQSSHESMPN